MLINFKLKKGLDQWVNMAHITMLSFENNTITMHTCNGGRIQYSGDRKLFDEMVIDWHKVLNKGSRKSSSNTESQESSKSK